MKCLIEIDGIPQTLDLMITPMMLATETGAPAYLNRAFQSQIGYHIGQLPDNDSWFVKAYPSPDYRKKVMESWEVAFSSALENGDTSIHVVSKICCADGVYRWFDVHQHAIDNKYALTFFNVDGLKQQIEDLTDTVQQKDRLLAIIAHDVRSPLTCIKQVVNSYDNFDLSEQEIEDLFFGLNNQVDYVFDILNSLLLRTGDDRGRFVEQQEPVYLKKFFIKYLNYYKERLREQNISLVLDLDDNALLNYDPAILDVICRNLLDNAIKYTSENGVISISFQKIANQAKLLIQDTGPGLSPEQVERILNNEAGHRAYKQITDGFGLGLILAKEILARHHGKLSLKSEIGIGTSFIIDITEHSLN